MNCKLRGAALQAVLDHAREARPRECCGVLLGAAHEINEVVRTRNVAGDANRFLIDPKDHIDARREGRRRGLEVVGFYHSHPHSAAYPSPRDLEEASYPGHLCLIVSLAAPAADVRLYRLEGETFREVALRIG